MGCACGGCNTCGGGCRGVKSDCKTISNYDIYKMNLCDVEKQLVKKGWSTQKVFKTKSEYLGFLEQFQKNN